MIFRLIKYFQDIVAKHGITPISSPEHYPERPGGHQRLMTLEGFVRVPCPNCKYEMQGSTVLKGIKVICGKCNVIFTAGGDGSYEPYVEDPEMKVMRELGQKLFREDRKRRGRAIPPP